jgi:DNA polymerase-3 subunit alpha
MAQKWGIKTLALTDINNTSASLDFVRMAPKYNIKPVLGVDFRNNGIQKFIILAQNNNGFQQINTYLSHFTSTQICDIPERAKTLKDTVVIYPYIKCRHFKLKKNEFLGINSEHIPELEYSRTSFNIDKILILHTCSFRDKKDFNTHRLLRAIDQNTLLSKLSVNVQGQATDLYINERLLKRKFATWPKLIENTYQLLARCIISFDFEHIHSKNQETFSGDEKRDFELLKTLCEQGLHYRYPNPNEIILNRIKKELNVIYQKNFVSYFLINWEIINYARSKDYFYVGRGSGANSIVAYLLRITDVDPVELDLYFERFINFYRKTPPDFDLDFSWRDRNDIIDFIFKRFTHTALIAVYNTFQYHASVRELGKVFGLPKHEIDLLSRGNSTQEPTFDKLSKLVIIYAKRIEGFPNYLGIHAGGIVISERPINYYTATFMPPKGYATTHFDMVTAEDIGLYKFDILSQRGLGKIKDAVSIIGKNHPNISPIDIHDIKRFKTDGKIKKLLRLGKVIGCFYVESPAMRILLKKLQVDSYLGLVAASSIIRPGVARSGMMQEYILRCRFPEHIKEAHPIMLKIMPETFGIMVYQEDVIKVAHHYGKLDLGEADVLRRGMSEKYRGRSEFTAVKDKFFTNCAKEKYPIEEVNEVWRQIESFAGYAFAKGHSASYAVESYQSLFLKAYYPLEYLVATLNNFGGFYQTELYIHEARMYGALISPPCVNTGELATSISGKHILLGFILVKSIETSTVEKICTNREKEGIFKDLDDFIERVPLSMEQLSLLIKIEAFRFTDKNPYELLWESHMKINKINMEIRTFNLFKVARTTYKMPTFKQIRLAHAFNEIEYFGFPLCNPFELLVTKVPPSLSAKDLKHYLLQEVIVYGYLVTYKKTRTNTGALMQFGNFLDHTGHFIDTVHFPQSTIQYPFKGRGIYLLKGVVMEEFDYIHISINQMDFLPIVEDPRYTDLKKGEITI